MANAQFDFERGHSPKSIMTSQMSTRKTSCIVYARVCV